MDASVALKWLLQETGSDAAIALIGAEALIAPDFLLLECANVLAMKARRGDLTAAAASQSLQVLEAAPLRIVPTARHVPRAQTLAMELGQTVYDSLYLSLALAEAAVLVTADSRFAQAVGAHPLYGPTVRVL